MIQLYKKLFNYHKNKNIQNRIKLQNSLGTAIRFWWQDRDIKVQVNEINKGYHKLLKCFDKQFVPVFVPPWGNISNAIINELSNIGIKGISINGNNFNQYQDLNNNNVQVDIHRWETKSEISYNVYIRQLGEIILDILSVIESKPLGQDKCINIGIVTHSQIMKNLGIDSIDRKSFPIN